MQHAQQDANWPGSPGDWVGPPGGWIPVPSSGEKVGLVCALLPFVLSFESYSLINGKLVNYTNLPATIGGAGALLLGLMSLRLLASTAANRKGLRIALILSLLGLGGVQIARGQGAFFEPEGRSSAGARPSMPTGFTAPATSSTNSPQDELQLGSMSYEACMGGQEDRCGEALERTAKLCESQPDEACDLYGVLLLEGRAGEKNPAEAVRASARGCEAEDMDACSNLGFLNESGQGTEKNLVEAEALYIRACKGGLGRACANLGTLLEQSESFERARAAFLDGCKADSPRGCRMYAYFLAEGKGGEKDLAEAIKWGTMGCEKGDSAACKNLGLDFGNDLDKAIPAFVRGCELGNPDACNLAGIHTYQHSKDPERARALFVSACEGKNAVGCKNLGVLFRDGEGGPQNTSRAFELFSQACELQSADGCHLQGDALWRGDGTMLDREAAKLAFDKACTMGRESSCSLPSK